ncbi:MAG: glycerophosphodiester phosphodiesterase family protein [Nitrospiraceae bacterium]
MRIKKGMKTALHAIMVIAVSAGVLALLILGLAMVLSVPSQGKRLAQSLGVPHPVVFAHRGASYLAPEETRPAFLLAREMGADCLELDLQRTKDGVLIAVHDNDLRRTTNVAEVFPARTTDLVGTFTFAELQKLDTGSWFNAQFPERAREAFRNLKILRLEDVMDLAEGGSEKPGLCIDTKAANRFPGIEEQLVETLAARGWIRRDGPGGPVRVIFESFEPESLARLKALAPQVPRILLVDEVLMNTIGWEEILNKASQVAAGIGTWGYRWSRDPEWSVKDAPKRYLITWPWYTGRAHRAGLLVHPWTIDDRWEMWMVSLAGADGVFTNRPDLALRFYGRADRIDLEALWEQIGY